MESLESASAIATLEPTSRFIEMGITRLNQDQLHVLNDIGQSKQEQIYHQRLQHWRRLKNKTTKLPWPPSASNNPKRITRSLRWTDCFACGWCSKLCLGNGFRIQPYLLRSTMHVQEYVYTSGSGWLTKRNNYMYPLENQSGMSFRWVFLLLNAFKD